MKYILLLPLFLSLNVNAIWFESKVVEVSTASNGHLFIRTVLNPNPKECPGTWAGANWDPVTESGKSLAASIALSAKAADRMVRFNIDDTKCGAGGLPLMNWIQQR